MPPKPKYTKEEIIDAAFEIVRENGIVALVARAVGKKLNTTASPIFTFFTGMEDLKAEVIRKAKSVCKDYVGECVNYSPAFKEFGMRYVSFAMKEPNLYKLLFAYGDAITLDYYSRFEDMLEPVLESIEESFQLDLEESKTLFNQMIIHSNGICAYIINGHSDYSPALIGEMLSQVCIGIVMVMQLKKGSFDPEKAKIMAAATANLPVKKQ